MALRFVDYQLR